MRDLLLGGPVDRPRGPRHCRKCGLTLGKGCWICAECGTENERQTCARWPGMHRLRCYAKPGDVLCVDHRRTQDEFMAKLDAAVSKFTEK